MNWVGFARQGSMNSASTMLGRMMRLLGAEDAGAWTEPGGRSHASIMYSGGESLQVSGTTQEAAVERLVSFVARIGLLDARDEEWVRHGEVGAPAPSRYQMVVRGQVLSAGRDLGGAKKATLERMLADGAGSGVVREVPTGVLVATFRMVEGVITEL